MPVGFKNGTGGSIQIAIDGVRAARHPHHFLGVTSQGIAAIISTSGNESCHVILRGSNNGANFDQTVVDETSQALRNAKLPHACSSIAATATARKTTSANPTYALTSARKLPRAPTTSAAS